MEPDPFVHSEISSRELFKTVAALGSLVPTSNPAVPILSNFLLEIGDDTLFISASDLYTSVVAQLPIRSSHKVKVAVPASLLIETLRNVPDQMIKIQINPSNYSMVITTKDGRYQIAGENHIDFPKISKIHREDALANNTPTFSVPVNTFKQAIKKTIFCK